MPLSGRYVTFKVAGKTFKKLTNSKGVASLSEDIPTISKYLDVIIPMIYKGNYNAGSSWIRKVTAAFVKQSSHAKIWSGIQTYKSDSDVTKLSATALMKDADAAAAGGVYGVILFRWGITNLINFNNV